MGKRRARTWETLGGSWPARTHAKRERVLRAGRHRSVSASGRSPGRGSREPAGTGHREVQQGQPGTHGHLRAGHRAAGPGAPHGGSGHREAWRTVPCRHQLLAGHPPGGRRARLDRLCAQAAARPARREQSPPRERRRAGSPRPCHTRQQAGQPTGTASGALFGIPAVAGSQPANSPSRGYGTPYGARIAGAVARGTGRRWGALDAVDRRTMAAAAAAVSRGRRKPTRTGTLLHTIQRPVVVDVGSTHGRPARAGPRRRGWKTDGAGRRLRHVGGCAHPSWPRGPARARDLWGRQHGVTPRWRGAACLMRDAEGSRGAASRQPRTVLLGGPRRGHVRAGAVGRQDAVMPCARHDPLRRAGL